MTIRVLLADDQDLVRSGLAMLIDAEPDLDVVGEARDGHDAISKVDELQPDIVLMDVRMPGLGGVEATRRITQDQVSRNPDRLIKVIMLTTFHDEDAVYAALRAGASGYLLKDTDANALITGIRAVAAGGAVLDPPVAWTLLVRLRRPTRPQRPHTRGDASPHRPRARRADPHRPRLLQQRDRRRSPLPRRGDREDTRQPPLHEARASRPQPGRRRRLPDRTRQARG